ncbi:hypothetical protein QFC24_006442 [Naganishia onofrii]|uniref:Uncharacterized protein n=1 Tax=Naganishia onofrii TaxID=1851511 RepID=A0ACC2X0V6_9TREE|nr:hypothetical protein QFC24_006442 [Naganishia onofrii]
MEHDAATREQYATAAPDEEENEDTLRIPEEKLNERENISSEEKLYAISEELGDLATSIEGDEKEVFVAELRGALFRGIIIVGNIHLTSHRIMFTPDNERDEERKEREEREPPTASWFPPIKAIPRSRSAWNLRVEDERRRRLRDCRTRKVRRRGRFPRGALRVILMAEMGALNGNE